MNSKLKPIYWTFGLLFFSFVFMSYNGNPPPFRTQAPPSSSSTCASGSCHSNGGTFTGSISFTGLPAEIEPNMSYTISVTVSNPDGNASLAGFQLIAIDASEANAGTFSGASTGSGLETNGTRTFFEHRGGQAFDAANQANWTVTWTAPATISGTEVQFWSVGNIANGNGGSSGDKIVFNNQNIPFVGAEPITAMISASSDVSCNGDSNGTATVTATGGAEPYTYNWSGNAGTTAMVTDLSAGTYTVTVTDAAMETSTATVTISEPTDLEVAITSLLNIDCNTMAGSVSVSASGGTPDYSYAWSNGNQSSFNNNLSEGIYTVTATDNNNCTETLMATITDNSVDPIADAGPSQSLNCATPQTVLNGNNSSTGVNFTYMWETTAGGNIVSDGNTLFPTVDAAGIYILTVINTSNDCRAQSQVEVSANFDLPTADIAAPSLLDCNGSMTLDASASSSNNGISFQWTSSNGGTISSGATTANPVISSAGTYEVRVIDNTSACFATTSVEVETADAPTVVVNGEDVINCFNSELALDGTGSSEGADISYTWTTDDGNIVSGATSISTVIDAAGTYTLTVLNTNDNCSSSASITVSSDMTSTVANGGPDLDLICSNTFIELQAEEDMSGQDVSYLWSTDNGNILAGANTLTPSVNAEGTYEFMVINNISGCSTSDFVMVGSDTNPPIVDAGSDQALGCSGPTVTLDGSNSEMGDNFIYSWSTQDGNIVSGDNTLSPVVDAAGTYSLAILNMNNGCSSSDEVNVSISDGFEATVASQENISCFGLMDGSATITVTEGTEPFTYDWSNGGTMATESNLAVGDYEVIVTDGTGCSNLLNIAITQPDTLVAHASSTDETSGGANDGRLMVLPTGGTTPYTIAWSNGANTAFVTNIPPGTYMVTVTDDNACESIETVVINAAGCSLALISTQQNDVSCNGSSDGEATILVNGGAMPYTYAWSSGGTDMTETGLAAGTYSVTVTDNGNCSIEADVTIQEPDVLVLSLESSTDETCAGLDGTATVLATGGTEPYQYRWLSTGDEDNMEDDLAAGLHTVSVMDANGCDTTIDVIIGAAADLEFQIESTNESSMGEADGTATVNVSGGTAPYTYLWNDDNAQTTATATGLSAGIYEVMISDDAGCTTVASVEVILTTVALSATASITPVSCNGEADGVASIDATGGISPYEYEWSAGMTTPTVINLPAGTYQVTVTDAAENETTIEIIITEPEPITTQITVTHETALNANDGTVTINISGGSGIYPDATDGQIVLENLAPADYSILITDSNNCMGLANFTINSFSCGNISSTITSTDASCPNVADGTASVSVSEGTEPYSYLWSNGATAASIEGLIAGEYSVTVTDDSNCETIAMLTLTDSDDDAPILMTQNISINLDADGNTITISPEQVDAGSSDNCSLVDLSLNMTEFDCSHLGENDLILTGTDASGNTSQTTVTVTIIDDIAPTVICPDNLVVTGSCNAIVEYDMPIATDNCDNELIVDLLSGLESGASFPAGTTTQIFSTLDASGNPSTCSFEVNVMGAVLMPSVVVTEPSCTEFNDGAIALNVEGGTPPYTIDWMGIDPTNVSAGSYTVFITDAQGCSTNLNIVVDEPTPILINNPVIINATDGQDNGEINAIISGGAGSYTYEWSLDGVVVSTDLNLVNAGAGTYILRVTDSNDCTVASDELTIDNVVSIQELESVDKLEVLPNPNTGRFILSLALYNTQTVQVSVFDFTGKELIRLAPERLLAKDFQLDLTNMSSGVYWLKVLVEGEMVVRKVVVQ